MKILVIAEKSEVGKAIDSAIKNNKYRPENVYHVAAASGHLLTLKSPADYDKKYATWDIADLPIAFPHWELVPKQDTASTNGLVAKKLNIIKSELDWCDTVIHAGDPDDEGQLIVDELLDYFNNTKPVYRLDVNDSTEKYIIKMLDRLSDNQPLRPMGRAAYARTVADAMFGFNFSRYYTCAYNSAKPLSIGRVQTPTLGLVVARDRIIENHIEQHYFVLKFAAETSGEKFVMTYEPEKDSPILADGKVLNKQEFDPIISALTGKRVPAKVSKKPIADTPPLPFNLSELQSYCSKRFSLQPQQVHDITQRLRNYSLITYNRSSCQYLHEMQHSEAPGIMPTVFSNLGITAPVDYNIKSKCFNDKYLEGEPHHAIIPTAQKYDISKLTDDELKVYKSICLYYILQFLPPREKLQTSVTVEFKNGSKLTASASETTKAGYYAYLHGGKTDDVSSPITAFSAGKIHVDLSEPNIEERKTTPPKRYTQASLIKDMTCVAKYVTDPKVAELLKKKDEGKQKENGSIGTPATRDKIVSGLITRGYIEEINKGKDSYIQSTELGRSFFDALPDEIKSPNVTTEWWVITQDIQHGVSDESALYKKLLAQIQGFLIAPPALRPLSGLTPRANIVGKCPRCGKSIIEGKKGFYCEGWKDQTSPCKFTIWKRHPLLAQSKRTVTATMAKSLLTSGKCDVKNLTAKSGKKYSGILTMKDTGQYVNLDFRL